MQTGEICREYLAAKDQNKQIKILADLNGCSQEDIRKELRDAAVDAIAELLAAADLRGRRKTMKTLKDILCHILFVAGFIFVASGMLEAVVLRLLEVIGW